MDSRPERIREVADASLKRLRVEAIDFFCQHRVDPGVPIEGVAGAVKDLIQAGKERRLPEHSAAVYTGGAQVESGARFAIARDGETPKRHGADRAGVLLAQKPWIVPIPGTTKIPRIEENVGAAAIEITPADLAGLERAAAEVAVQGERYPKHIEQMTGL